MSRIIILEEGDSALIIKGDGKFMSDLETPIKGNKPTSGFFVISGFMWHLHQNSVELKALLDTFTTYIAAEAHKANIAQQVVDVPVQPPAPPVPVPAPVAAAVAQPPALEVPGPNAVIEEPTQDFTGGDA